MSKTALVRIVSGFCHIWHPDFRKQSPSEIWILEVKIMSRLLVFSGFWSFTVFTAEDIIKRKVKN